MEGCNMGHKDFKIICYEDDAVLISNNENNLQRMFCIVNKTVNFRGKNVNACQSVKNQSNVNWKYITQLQTSGFHYLGIDITCDVKLHHDRSTQVKKGAMVAEARGDIIWRNIYLYIYNINN